MSCDALLGQNQFANAPDECEPLETAPMRRVRLQLTALACLRTLLGVGRSTEENLALHVRAEVAATLAGDGRFWKLYDAEDTDHKVHASLSRLHSAYLLAGDGPDPDADWLAKLWPALADRVLFGETPSAERALAAWLLAADVLRLADGDTLRQTRDPLKVFDKRLPTLAAAGFDGRALVLADAQRAVMGHLLRHGAPTDFVMRCTRAARDCIVDRTGGDAVLTADLAGVSIIFAHWFDTALGVAAAAASGFEMAEITEFACDAWRSLATCRRLSGAKQVDCGGLVAPIERCLLKADCEPALGDAAAESIAGALEIDSASVARALHSASSDDFLRFLLRHPVDGVPLCRRLFDGIFNADSYDDHVAAVKRLLLLDEEKCRMDFAADAIRLCGHTTTTAELGDLLAFMLVRVHAAGRLDEFFEAVYNSAASASTFLQLCERDDTRGVIKSHRCAQRRLFDVAWDQHQLLIAGEPNAPDERTAQALAAHALILCAADLVSADCGAALSSLACRSAEHSHACVAHLARRAAAGGGDGDTAQFCRALHSALVKDSVPNAEVVDILQRSPPLLKSVVAYFSQLLFEQEDAEIEAPAISSLRNLLGASATLRLVPADDYWRSLRGRLEPIARTLAAACLSVGLYTGSGRRPALLPVAERDYSLCRSAVQRVTLALRLGEDGGDVAAAVHETAWVLISIAESRRRCALWLRRSDVDGALRDFDDFYLATCQSGGGDAGAPATSSTPGEEIRAKIRQGALASHLFSPTPDGGDAHEADCYKMEIKCRAGGADVSDVLERLSAEKFATFEGDLLLCTRIDAGADADRTYLTAAFARLLAQICDSLVDSASDQHWDFLCCNALALLQTCQQSLAAGENRTADRAVCILLMEALRLFDRLCTMATDDGQRTERTSEFLEFHLPSAFDGVCRMFVSGDLYEGGADWLNGVYRASLAHTVVHCTVANGRAAGSLGVPQLDGLQPHFDARLEGCGYADWLHTVIVRCTRSFGGSPAVAAGGRALLSLYTRQIAEADCGRLRDAAAVAALAGKEAEETVDSMPYAGYILALLPGAREEFVASLPTVDEDDFDPPVAYVHLWNLLLDYFLELPAEHRPTLTSHLQRGKQVHALLDDAFGALPQSLSADVVTFAEPKEGRCEHCPPSVGHSGPADSPATAYYGRLLRLCTRAMACLPAVARSWYVNQSRSDAALVSKFVSKYVSPVICADELNAVRAAFAEEKLSELEIQVRPSVREIGAQYAHDDCSLGLRIALPADYPLRAADVRHDDGTVTKGRRELNKKWMFQLNVFLTHQNGRMHEAISMWKRSLDKYVAGGDECSICMMTVHADNFRLPNVTCRQCQHKFHNVCIYKWFSSSAQSTCPLCRKVF